MAIRSSQWMQYHAIEHSRRSAYRLLPYRPVSSHCRKKIRMFNPPGNPWAMKLKHMVLHRIDHIDDREFQHYGIIVNRVHDVGPILDRERASVIHYRDNKACAFLVIMVLVPREVVCQSYACIKRLIPSACSHSAAIPGWARCFRTAASGSSSSTSLLASTGSFLPRL